MTRTMFRRQLRANRLCRIGLPVDAKPLIVMVLMSLNSERERLWRCVLLLRHFTCVIVETLIPAPRSSGQLACVYSSEGQTGLSLLSDYNAVLLSLLPDLLLFVSAPGSCDSCWLKPSVWESRCVSQVVPTQCWVFTRLMLTVQRRKHWLQRQGTCTGFTLAVCNQDARPLL